MKKLGNLLVQYDLITSEQLQKALGLQKTTGLRIGDQLKAMGIISQDEINWIVTKQYDISYIILTPDIIDLNVFESFPYPVLKKHDIVPVREEEGRFFFALSDPSEEEAVQVISDMTDGKFCLVLGEYDRIKDVLEHYFSFFPFPVNRPVEKNYEDPSRIAFFSDPDEFIAYLSGFSLHSGLDELSVFTHDNRLIVAGLQEHSKQYISAIPSCWEQVKDILNQKEFYPFFHGTRGKVLVNYLFALSDEIDSGLIMKQEDAALFERDAFLRFGEILWETLGNVGLPEMWIFSLSYFNAVACFHIVYKMFFRHLVIFNHLQYRQLPIPYVFVPTCQEYPFQHLSVLTDNHLKDAGVYMSGKGNLFLLDQNKIIEPADFTAGKAVHISEKKEGEIKVELIK